MEHAEVASNPFGMATERHAQQVWDRIEQGQFYVITENVRPYVDHDHPFGALDIIRERVRRPTTPTALLARWRCSALAWA